MTAASPRLGVLLAAAMFVFVIDTSFMNVSISAVVHDLDTTVSGVRAAIAIEALVSAAFSVIGEASFGDLYGRKRAYTIGLIFYAIGALAMVFAQGLGAIIAFWAVLGGLGASSLPSGDAVPHPRQLRREGAREGVRLGWSGWGNRRGHRPVDRRLPHDHPVVARRVHPRGRDHRRRPAREPAHRRHVPYTGDRSIDGVGAFLSVVGMGGLVVGVLVWQAGGEAVIALLAIGAAAMAGLYYWLRRRKRSGKPALIDLDLFRSDLFRIGVVQIFMQQVALGGLLIALPIYLQIVWGCAPLQGGGDPRAPVADNVRRRGPRRKAGRTAAAEQRHPGGLPVAHGRDADPHLHRPEGRRRDRACDPAGPGEINITYVASQLNNYALAPISEERVGEAAGVTSATSSFGLSFGLAVAGAILLAALSISFTSMAQASAVLPPEDQQRVAEVLEENAQVVSDTQLQELLAGQPQAVQDEIIRINDEARSVALQVALSLSLLAAVIGAFNAFRMMRLPDPEPSSAVEGLALA